MRVGIEVDGYLLRLDRRYDPDTHLWVLDTVDDTVDTTGDDTGHRRVRLGLDSLTADTYGALAQLALASVGTPVGRGDPFGSLEAAKFVGPLVAPVSGIVAAVNPDVQSDPELVLRDPYERGWLAEISGVAPAGGLVGGDDAHAWFTREVAAYREKGLVAE